MHGHFYQPPRESPWTGEVELQESASPFHDWNERITAECYLPNTACPILEGGRIRKTVNNYSRMSFNFGPTLLSWMERCHPEAYEAILRADSESRQAYSGHGSAIAQVYNHMIMPLANRRDKRTQVAWGVADFEGRFGRFPEGMWLPETAVDLDTLETLSEAGILFTILGPHQAARVRRVREDAWVRPSAGLDTRQAYVCNLPSGRAISIFFYDQGIARDIAFGDLLQDGAELAKRLVGACDERQEAQLVNVATDGETYGHHHKHGEMALAFCIDFLESKKLARTTNYGEFLARFPPKLEVQVQENTSWSCAHGIERWRSNCGCALQHRPGWSQEWRRPLREAIDWLGDRLAATYAVKTREYFADPWRVRNEYMAASSDYKTAFHRLIEDKSTVGLTKESRATLLDLLEMERCSMLMYTSCGWFWDEISGIETVQILRYAARAMQLAISTAGVNLKPEFLGRLERAPSNLQQFRSGKGVYTLLVEPEAVSGAGQRKGA